MNRFIRTKQQIKEKDVKQQHHIVTHIITLKIYLSTIQHYTVREYRVVSLVMTLTGVKKSFSLLKSVTRKVRHIVTKNEKVSCYR